MNCICPAAKRMQLIACGNQLLAGHLVESSAGGGELCTTDLESASADRLLVCRLAWGR